MWKGKFMYVILVYDISLEDSGNKVLPKVYKTCKKYLHHIQNSVFEGELTNAQIMQLKYELDQYIRKDLDSVIIFRSRHERWLEKEMWGLEDDKTSCFL